MIEKLLSSMVPMVAKKLASMPLADKRAVISFYMVLCWAYVNGDRVLFDVQIAKMTIPGDWRTVLIEALWHEDQG